MDNKARLKEIVVDYFRDDEADRRLRVNTFKLLR